MRGDRRRRSHIKFLLRPFYGHWMSKFLWHDKCLSWSALLYSHGGDVGVRARRYLRQLKSREGKWSVRSGGDKEGRNEGTCDRGSRRCSPRRAVVPLYVRSFFSSI